MPKTFDVFLSYNSKDQPAARELAEALRGRKLKVWFDQWEVRAGQRWQKVLEAAIESIRSAAVLVGKDGLGPWQDQETEAFLRQFANRAADSVIPVLLPGAPQGSKLPLFLEAFVRVDLRDGPAAEKLDALVYGITGRKPRPRRQPGAVPRPARPEEPEDAGLAAYRRWALERFRGLSLIGLGAADVRMRFEEVYVPLRVARRPQRFESEKGERPGRGLGEVGSEEIEIEEIFATGVPHSLLLGHPGAGKTTALLKLLHLCLAEGANPEGLKEGTVPVLLRLRHLDASGLDRPLADFVERELAEVSGGALPAGLGARLWERGHLLLLLDGLDEIAEEALRRRVCGFLDFALTGAERRHVRAVLSCRFAGYGGEIRFGEHVLPLEVRPLGAEPCRRLVRQWFREARYAVRDFSEAEARQAAEGLIAALDGPGYGTQQWKVLIGSPLLLTLLCVIVLRGGQMPRHRVAFFDQSLRVLLAQWNRGKRDDREPVGEPPLDVETALTVLRSLAWELHARHSRDDLSLEEIADHAEERLAALGRPASGFEIAGWLHREAGVLAEYAPRQYGFLHLGIQEYLTALHIASRGEELLGELCARCSDEWWHEVLLLAVGMPGRRLCGPLMERLLAANGLPERGDLLRACLAEAAEVDLGPLLARLGPEEPPERLAVVLRLLRGSSDPRLPALVAPLVASPDVEVAALARQIAAELSRPAPVAEPVCDLFVVHHPDDREGAGALVRILRRAGRHVLVAGQDPLSETIAAGTAAVAVVAGPCGRPPWEVKDLYRTLRLFARRRRPLVPVRLPGAPELPALPADLPVVDEVDLRAGLVRAVEALELALEKPAALAAPPAGEPLREPGRAWIEPVTGIRWLWIPGGRFQMGGNRYPDEGPVHWVRISPFWLGETPVTNRHYAVFLERTGHEEPPTWRDRRFSAPDQPVVGVSWHDAQAFCEWLSQVSGQKLSLPSEAQWEFAARGPHGREYPWGGDPPDATRACFGLDFEKGQPAPAGTYSAGRGPFGTLDQAGNVWEWCLDVWDEHAYQKRTAKGGEPVDPVAVGKGDLRPLRGGGWIYPAEFLRAAYRLWNLAGLRNDVIGFRVAAAPASTSTS